MLCDACGLGLLLSLPDDVFAVVSRSLSPRDVCNLGLCCKGLYDLVASDRVWLSQCDNLGIVSYRELTEWRKGVCSYKSLCRFLVGVQPLLGIWVHQNPELGNVVYVMPGYISVVGCRIIPQELRPLGLEDGHILWAPVFEIICDSEGLPAFFLHGRERGNDYVYPGLIKAVERNCNVLLLEVEPRQLRNGGKLVQSKSFSHHVDKEMSGKLCSSDNGISRSQRIVGHSTAAVPFNRLSFGDRRKLLETVTGQIRIKLSGVMNLLLFPCLGDEEDFQKDISLLNERRLQLLQMPKLGGALTDLLAGSECHLNPTHSELGGVRKNLDVSRFRVSQIKEDSRTQSTKRKSLAGYVKDSLKQIIGKSQSVSSSNDYLKRTSSSNGNKHAQLHEFLRAGDAMGLTLHASTMKLSYYRAWPNMHENRFALYKLPMRAPVSGEEFAGLWGGTFGWPPGKSSEDKPGKALFLLLLSYKESQGQQLLIATKILEGTHYVLHPNGSAMFIVNIKEPSFDTFPWVSDGDSNLIDVKYALKGEGIANGYGFRYPGAKPGSLFVVEGGLLAFIWKESRAILTLQRLNLEELLKKGERVPPLSPVSNFAYLTRSYSNVFTGFSNVSHDVSSPRKNQF